VKNFAIRNLTIPKNPLFSDILAYNIPSKWRSFAQLLPNPFGCAKIHTTKLFRIIFWGIVL